MPDIVRWGIVGTGAIANKFAQGLQALDDAELVAVSSRAQSTADAFGDKYDIQHRHVGVENLAADTDVDAVYVATPHPMHKPDTLACLEGGKAVLCEKPFAVNAIEAQAMIDCARSHGLFLMEAMWTHCFPAIRKCAELVRAGQIGDVRQVQVSFSFRADWNPAGRLLNPALGGGGLLDVGVYTVALAQLIYDREPQRIVSMADIGATGVDEQAALVLGYEGSALAVLTCGVRVATVHEAYIYGEYGYIHVPHLFWQADRIRVIRGGEGARELVFPRLGNGYSFEAREVGECLRAGKTQSEIVPLARTMQVMRILDKVRGQWHLHYPMEES